MFKQPGCCFKYKAECGELQCLFFYFRFLSKVFLFRFAVDAKPIKVKLVDSHPV